MSFNGERQGALSSTRRERREIIASGKFAGRFETSCPCSADFQVGCVADFQIREPARLDGRQSFGALPI